MEMSLLPAPRQAPSISTASRASGAIFSATMPPAVERLTRKYLKKPAIITIGEAGRAVDTVEQRVEFINGDEKKKYVFVLFFAP